jgi:hypothetical protein
MRGIVRPAVFPAWQKNHSPTRAANGKEQRASPTSDEEPQNVHGSRALVDHVAGYNRNRIPCRPSVIGSDNACRPQHQDHPVIVSVYIAECVNRGGLAALDKGFNRESRKEQKEEHSGSADSIECSRTSARKCT